MQLNQEVDWRVSIRKPSKGEVIKKEEAGLHTICTQCQDPYLEQGETLPFSLAGSGKDPAIPWVWGMGVLGMAMFVNEHKCSFLQRYPHSLPYWFSKHVFYVYVCAVCLCAHLTFSDPLPVHLELIYSEPSASAYLCPPFSSGIAGIHICAWLCTWVPEIWPWDLILLQQAPHPLNYLKFAAVDRCEG